MPYSSMPYSSIPYSSMRYSSMPCSSMPCSSMPYTRGLQTAYLDLSVYPSIVELRGLSYSLEELYSVKSSLVLIVGLPKTDFEKI